MESEHDWTTLLHLSVEHCSPLPAQAGVADRVMSRAIARSIDRLVTELEVCSTEDAADLHAHYGID